MPAEASSLTLGVAPQVLQRGLGRLRRRARALLAFRLATMAGLAMAGAWAVAVVGLRLKGVWYPPLLPEVALGLVAAGALVAALLWPLPDEAMAVSADRRLGLRDRLSTAAHLLRAAGQSGMQQAMVMDAVAHIRSAQPRDAYPVRAYRSTKAAAACVAALVLAQALPIPPLLVAQREREEKAALRRVAAKVEPVAKKLDQEAKKGADLQAKEMARRLQKLAQQMRQGRLDKKQALLSLKAMEKELEALEKRAAPPPLKTAEKAAEQLKQAGQEALATRAEQLAKRAAERGKQEEAKRLQDLARKAGQAKNPSELRNLAKQLNQEAKALGEQEQPALDLPAALSEALANQDLQKALDKLSELAPQLSGELSKEQLEELAKELEELAKALENTDLEELSECLKEAAECLKKGDCEGAKKCLAQGLKKCEGKLKALGLAKACGECKGALAAAAEGLKGSQLGSPTRSESAESGLGIGPDQGSQKSIPPNAPAASLYAPRTTATSGSVERVPGQVRPQGEMMAITEKGAPEKVTESRVPYYEVLPEYSKAAEEALSREEVPPAYRGTVRDYFNALQSGTK